MLLNFWIQRRAIAGDWRYFTASIAERSVRVCDFQEQGFGATQESNPVHDRTDFDVYAVGRTFDKPSSGVCYPLMTASGKTADAQARRRKPGAPFGDFSRRHRDTATLRTRYHRFVMSADPNDDHESSERRFPERGRTICRPPGSGAMGFSCGRLQEAPAAMRGRRFGLFTFLFGHAAPREGRRLRATGHAGSGTREGV